METIKSKDSMEQDEQTIPVPETPEERLALANKYEAALKAGDTMPGITPRHIGQEALISINRLYASTRPQSGL